jgi:hypothetical protein
MSSAHHYLAYCQCLREIVSCEGWNAVDDPEVDRIYDQMDVHWEFLNETERVAIWDYSAQLQTKENQMNAQVHQGRWGFHPCDYQTFRKLKELHKWYYEALCEWSNWCRWARKEPQNRVIRRKLKDSSGNPAGREIVGPRPEPSYCPYFHNNGQAKLWNPPNEMNIVAMYQNARRPKVTPEEVEQLDQARLVQLMALYDAIKGWHEEHRKAA